MSTLSFLVSIIVVRFEIVFAKMDRVQSILVRRFIHGKDAVNGPPTDGFCASPFEILGKKNPVQSGQKVR